jgi:hypothetical protein
MENQSIGFIKFLRINSVDPVYNDIGVYDTSLITSDIHLS